MTERMTEKRWEQLVRYNSSHQLNDKGGYGIEYELFNALAAEREHSFELEAKLERYAEEVDKGNSERHGEE